MSDSYEDFEEALIEAMMRPIDPDAPTEPCCVHMIRGSLNSGKLLIPDAITTDSVVE